MENSYYQQILNSFFSFIESHPLLGWIVAIILFLLLLLNFLSKLIPQIEIIKSKIITPFARKRKFKILVKAAIKSDIRGNANLALQKLKKELPSEWIQEMDIEWVTRENKEDFLNDNNPVIRMRPLENQEQNFVTAIYYFLNKSFFPKTKRVIPETPRDAAILQICRRLIRTQKKNLEPIFEDYVLEPIVGKRKGILKYLERYEKIDNQGFFTGTFLREIHEIANQVRFTPARNMMGSEVVEVLKHIEDFLQYLSKTEQIPPGGWYRFGPITSYSFLLIAHPAKTAGGIRPYINRVKEKIGQGTPRLYVFGTSEEGWFAKSIIAATKRYVPEYKLVEKFVLYRDYRGNMNGIGALFIAKDKL